MKTLPIGISTFENIINGNGLYIDKTENLYHLIKDALPKRYFFSRPRRFGKSLTCSTLKAIFNGKKELFKDLWIYSSDYNWPARPVLHFDFSQISHNNAEQLIKGLDESLNRQAKQYNIILQKTTLKSKLTELVVTLSTQYCTIAVIIDEYDKPIIDLINKPNLAEESRNVLQDFFSTFKGEELDKHIHFLFITGVSKFSKTALFSGLNNLQDLTNNIITATLVGYTDQEVDHYLTNYITHFADHLKKSYDNTRKELKKWYNGYKFSDSHTTVYNPFSLHNCLTQNMLLNYWFTSGTPNFLIQFIAKNPSIALSIETIDGSFFAQSSLESFSLDFYYQKYKTLLLQAGYLTFISDYDPEMRGYVIGYPNQEVRYSMTEQIMEHIGNISAEDFSEFGKRFKQSLADDNLILFCKHLEDFIKIIPHNIRVDREKFYHQVFFMICLLFGNRPASEVATEEGFMDLLLEGTDNTFVVEFKRNSTPEIALAQIEKKRYWESYAILETKKIILAGVTFNKTDSGVEVLCKTKIL